MLDKNSPVPMYIQIEEFLKGKIFEEEYKIGENIPSEREFSEQLGVSRMTVRHAITNLVNSGLLYREKGRGTYVANPKLEQPLSGLTSFTEDMRSRGYEPSNKLIRFEKIIPPIDIAKALQMKMGDEVFSVVRIRNADQLPMAIERTYIPVEIIPDLDKSMVLGSLYSLIEERHHQKIGHASQLMEAALVTKEDSKLLNIEQPSAVLIIERKSYLSTGIPFELVRSTYRADRYKFISEIQR
ncbi:GntR family transcriptional regulator [Viridibacillus sp. FSL H8-0123]|uniref:GntR family transcriptional regulator n=1 Tax=Viridibacillus sp. FSL H8-0123 TaxID=1928922 RepID=UPI00096C29D6|nr:GntR family transcriptional regulator [Viridibacillus sp. FSL H8-0123]OMC85402.1 phosphonate metabolism transcriptional regulator PhnF [Viridibacillus sp. FSL H8-0123]